MDEYRSLFTGLSQADDPGKVRFDFVWTDRSNNCTSVKLRQVYDSVPVYQGGLVIRFDSAGHVIHAAGTPQVIERLGNAPRLTSGQAMATVWKAVAPDTLTLMTKPEFVVYPYTSPPRYAYWVRAEISSRQTAFRCKGILIVDAESGTILEFVPQDYPPSAVADSLVTETDQPISVSILERSMRYELWNELWQNTLTKSWQRVAPSISWDTCRNAEVKIVDRILDANDRSVEAMAREYLDDNLQSCIGNNDLKLELISVDRPSPADYIEAKSIIGLACQVYFQPLFKGVPVRDARVRVTMLMGGLIQCLATRGLRIDDVDIHPKLTPLQAVDRLRERILPDILAYTDPLELSVITRDSTQLVYHVHAYVWFGPTLRPFDVFVNASSGEIAKVVDCYCKEAFLGSEPTRYYGPD